MSLDGSPTESTLTLLVVWHVGYKRIETPLRHPILSPADDEPGWRRLIHFIAPLGTAAYLFPVF